jgi:hypothetical protein
LLVDMVGNRPSCSVSFLLEACIFIYVTLSSVGIALLSLLSLLIGLAPSRWIFILANHVDHGATPWRESWDLRKAWRI